MLVEGCRYWTVISCNKVIKATTVAVALFVQFAGLTLYLLMTTRADMVLCKPPLYKVKTPLEFQTRVGVTFC
jgi:hypothetical protein